VSTAVTAAGVRASATTTVVAKRRRLPVGRFFFWIVVALIILWLMFPFYWAVRTSITPEAHMYDTPVQYFPSNPTLGHYADVFGNSLFLQSLVNSAIVGISVTVLALAIGASAAYALARFNFRGRTFMMYVILSMTMFPQIAILNALFQVVKQYGLYDTLWALIVTYMLFTLPFTVWVLTSFFKALPRELEEASYVDGANPFQTFVRIMLPLAVPGMVTTGLLALITAWNEFLFAVTFEISPSHQTVPLAIFDFTSIAGSQYAPPWGTIMAATVVVTIPLVVLVLVFQRRIIAGLTAGAVKG
jgi:trehalose/maltose transport system permease protein